MSVLDKVRRWIDGESAELVLEEAARKAQVKPRSQAEEFIVKIARAVEEVMQRELVPLPQGTTIIPTEYMIFLNEEDDKDWQGIKRRGLEQGLYHILAERAKEIAGKRKLETKSFIIELRVDGTLEKGEVRVQHSWEDSSGNKTGVLARPKPQPQQPQQPKPAPPPDQLPPTMLGQPNPMVSPPNFVNASQSLSGQTGYSAPVQPTVPNVNPPGVQPIPGSEGEEMTHVQKRNKELYRLEIWRDGVRQNVVPVFQNEIRIGRGSKSKPVEIMLTGDPEISRHHVNLIKDQNNQFWLINVGRNPAMINDYELPIGQRVSVSPGIPIHVCSYLLRIQPK
ncbi:MAG: FHA domain-containing protein [Pyrinomonadaceae bacterium]